MGEGGSQRYAPLRTRHPWRRSTTQQSSAALASTCIEQSRAVYIAPGGALFRTALVEICSCNTLRAAAGRFDGRVLRRSTERLCGMGLTGAHVLHVCAQWLIRFSAAFRAVCSVLAAPACQDPKGSLPAQRCVGATAAGRRRSKPSAALSTGRRCADEN